MDKLEEIRRPVEDDLKRYREIFDAALTHENPLIDSIFKGMKERRGKQMRPLLLLLAARALGKPNRKSYIAAVMLEMLHTASLVHDDIVDNASERRGKTSVNAAYGNSTAVLVGDYLLSSALEQATLTEDRRIVAYISRLGKQLASGELLQSSKPADEALREEAYYEVVRLKTASLFSAAAELGAMSVDAAAGDVERMRQMGEYIGICFQIKDDILDYSGTPELGKPVGSDLTEGKLTLPLLLALKLHGDDRRRALACRVHDLKATPEEIADLVDFMKRNGGVDAATAVIADLSRRAVDLTLPIADDSVRRSLQSYISFVSERNN